MCYAKGRRLQNMPTVKGKFASRFYQRVVVPTDEGRALINAYVFDGRTTEELANQYGCSPATIADKASERDVSCETKPQGLDFQSIEDTGNLFSGYFQGLHNGSAPDFLDIASERLNGAKLRSYSNCAPTEAIANTISSSLPSM